jgi:hypothetical protein
MWYLDVIHFAAFFGLVNYVSTNTMKFLLKNTKINEKEYILVKVGEKCASTIHSTIAVYLAVNILMNDYIWSNRISFISKESILLSHFTCGYFLYDVVLCLARYKDIGPVFCGHAILAFVINLISIISGVGHFYTASFIIWETSTPFVNIRYFMNKLKISRFQNINNASILLAFLIFRIIWGSFIYYIIILDTIYLSEGWLLKIPVFIAFLMNAMNYYWFYKMVNIAINRILLPTSGLGI